MNFRFLRIDSVLVDGGRCGSERFAHRNQNKDRTKVLLERVDQQLRQNALENVRARA